MLSLSLPTWMRTALLLFALLMSGVVHTQPRHIDDRRVTAADVTNAIRNSPNASPWLRANADAVANLAMFESGGRLGVYNGSCCFGVLQMNRTNIRAYAGVSPEVFRTWSLQDQVNAWSRLTDDALRSRVPRALIAMGTFDGRPVDGNLVLACVQLGIGNCQRMIQSGRCSGFADRNGTTICAMADRIRGAGDGTTVTPTDPGTNFGPGTGGINDPEAGSGWGFNPPNFDCVRGEDGGCMSMSEAMRQGFQSGSGVTMDRMRTFNQMLLVALTLLVVGSALVGVWRQYAAGAIAKSDLLLYSKRGFLIVGMVFVVMSLL